MPGMHEYRFVVLKCLLPYYKWLKNKQKIDEQDSKRVMEMCRDYVSARRPVFFKAPVKRPNIFTQNFT